jgi:hypothetical protein
MSGDLVQLPSMIDPDARYVEFRAYECKVCGETGPITNAQNPEWVKWGDRHNAETGHTEYYQWHMARYRAQNTTVGALRNRARRG